MLLALGFLPDDASWWMIGFSLLIAHSIADYALQNDFLARFKNHRMEPTEGSGLEGTSGVWFHCLTAHSLIHAGFVWAVTGLVLLGLVEFVLHWVIDFSKSEKWIGYHTDQFLHALCKALYVIAMVAGLVPMI